MIGVDQQVTIFFDSNCHDSTGIEEQILAITEVEEFMKTSQNNQSAKCNFPAFAKKLSRTGSVTLTARLFLLEERQI
jgi:hypothetical protein